MKYVIKKLRKTGFWCLMCPNGDVFFESGLKDCITRMDLHAYDIPDVA